MNAKNERAVSCSACKKKKKVCVCGGGGGGNKKTCFFTLYMKFSEYSKYFVENWESFAYTFFIGDVIFVYLINRWWWPAISGGGQRR